ncbi:MAG: hypothetical protein MJ141_09290 [Clostridia bacterium]|nr:hypothetical protein [Clostridia bacterium]
MSYIYLSSLADGRFVDAIKARGHEAVLLPPREGVEEEVASHADIFYCRAGILPSSPLYYAGKDFHAPAYPAVAAYNAVFLKDYFIHKLNITSLPLLAEAGRQGLRKINVRQGYTKCNLVVVDGSHVITADEGLYKVLSVLPGLEVLNVEEGEIALGKHRGFLGGTSGRIGDEIWFHGALAGHPDEKKIRGFIESCGCKVVDFPFPLRDIGSVIESDFLVL